MGVAYHGRYAAWLEMARTEYLRRTGVSYREVEDSGLLLAVADLSLRFLRPARYDDLVRITCWVRDIGSRRVTFGYLVRRAETGERLALAETSLIALNREFQVVRLPAELRARLLPGREPDQDETPPEPK